MTRRQTLLGQGSLTGIVGGSADLTDPALYLTKDGNLAELEDAEEARINLGLEIGSDVPAYNADLAAIAALGVGIVSKTGAGTAAALASTGSGNVVRATSPTLVTPTLGAAVVTTINGNTVTPGTGTLTLGSGKTLTFSNTLTLTATDGNTLAIGAGGTLAGMAYQSGSWASPGAAIGSGTPVAITGTTGSFSDTLTSTITADVNVFQALAATTNRKLARIGNTGGELVLGIDSSAGGAAIASSGAYDGAIRCTNPISFSANAGSTQHMRLLTTGLNVPAGWVKPASYTVATLPSAATAGAGACVWCSDETAGSVLVTSNGTNWKRAGTQTTAS